ncbi:hypothetical protein DICPUDRAFT_155634 [Dictyostelium purpureum]|uniref:Uncharacterized protein n=1 Tax=Dictyostelium purpureum TaxID=5786 RepID=F0ZUI4_DICPU|nr:uncharacterized protein DICPUDRAFT_155634 [Dictyostelium purpureum]EGC32398.1 hypothetical protein DICPUDRAFT_155634 [Dictyostelium purpureum]|eukprot:XP_003291084.1 hypothetical protein DICPUDRAFT_155634 [Dictyostelium purpureum]
MSFRQPSESTTLLITSVMWVIVIGVLRFGAPYFKSSEVGTIIGGLIGSLLFFFQITFIGSIKRDIKWFELIFSIFTTAIISSTVHRVSGTVSVLSSIAIVFYLNHVSHKIHSKIEEANSVSTGGKKKRN